MRSRWNRGFLAAVLTATCGASRADLGASTGDRALCAPGVGTAAAAVGGQAVGWRPNPKSFLMAMRANPEWFAAWFAGQIPSLSQRLGANALTFGIISGDPHPGNFAVANIGGHRVYGLVDMDDGGWGPLLSDIIRYVSVVSEWPVPVTREDLFTAYLSGLRDGQYGSDSLPPPKVIREALEAPAAEARKLEEHVLRKLTSFSDQEKLKPKKQETEAVRFVTTDKTKLIALAQALPEHQQLLAAARATFESHLPRGKILDVAVRVKDEGGSQGLPRFWFLVRREGVDGLDSLRIYEFKQMPENSAAAQYGRQDDPLVRIRHLNDVYRYGLSSEDFGVTKIVFNGISYAFWWRPRTRPPLKFVEAPKTPQESDDARRVLLWIARFMGERHALQPAGAIYRPAILALSPSHFIDVANQTIDDALVQMRQLNPVSPPNSSPLIEDEGLDP